jgi:hypothetical protein
VADQLATASDLAAALQRDVDTASATLVIEASTAVVQEAAGGQRILQVVGDTAAIRAPQGQWLELPQRPVTAVTSVTLADGTVVTAGTTTGTYRRLQHRLWRDTGWAKYSPWAYVQPFYYGLCDGPGEVTVVYTHGYAAGSQELQLARGFVLTLARAVFTNPDGASKEQIDDYQVAYDRAAAALEASPYLQKSLRRQYGKRAGMVHVV